MRLINPLTNAKVWKSPSVVVLVLANLIPLAGVMFFGWEIFPIMVLFWLENVVVGGLNVLKMLLAGGFGALPGVKLFLVPFFLVHYGLFTFVHGVFVFALFGGQFQVGGGPFPSPAVMWELVAKQNLGWAILALVASHVFSFGWNYVAGGKYRVAALPLLMFAPYGRVVVLHLALLGGGFLMVMIGTPAVGLVLLVILKIGLDVPAHAIQHGLGGSGLRPRRAAPTSATPDHD